MYTEVDLVTELRNCEGRGGSFMLLKCKELISQFLLNNTILEKPFRFITLQQT
jgi:hypothetical protein